MADDQQPASDLPPRVIALGPELLLRGTVIPSFAAYAVTGEDNLRVWAMSSVVNIQVSVQGRFLDAAQGQTIPFSFPLLAPGNRTLTVQDFPLGTGYMLNILAYGPSSGVQIGQCYVCVQLVRGLFGGKTVLATLLAGYVGGFNYLGWPGSPITNMTDGPGALLNIAVSSPAAGQEWGQAVPTNARWQVLAVIFQLVTGTTVLSRMPAIAVQPTAQVDVFAGTPFQQAANLTDYYTFAPGWPYLDASGRGIIDAPLPRELIVRGGASIYSSTSGLQATDQYSNVVLTVREWIDVG